MRLLALVTLVLGMTIAVSGCGKKTIKSGGAANVVVKVVSSKTHFTPKDVKCPSGKEAKVGVTFDCTFTGPDADYVAHMRVTKVEGTSVAFDVQSVPKR